MERTCGTTRTEGTLRIWGSNLIARSFEGKMNNHKIEHRRICGTIRTYGTVSTCGTKWTLSIFSMTISMYSLLEKGAFTGTTRTNGIYGTFEDTKNIRT